jgi:exopolysaccharide biosynthesis protein
MHATPGRRRSVRWIRRLLFLAAASAAFPIGGAADAHSSPPLKTMLHRTSIQIRVRKVHGHLVKSITWKPGDRHLRVTVGYARHGRAPVAWGAFRHTNLAVMNGGTWHWSTGVPVGTVVSNGRVIHIDRRIPAVGYTATGDLVVGTRAARAAHVRNIVNAKAYLVLHGRAMRRKPSSVTPTQWRCDAPGTDGAEGCYRSVVAKFRNGRVGMLEMAYISMPAAARLLVKMGAESAITFDSGGSATVWSAAGHGGCPHPWQRGSCFGLTQRIGMRWQRPVATTTILSYTR